MICVSTVVIVVVSVVEAGPATVSVIVSVMSRVNVVWRRTVVVVGAVAVVTIVVVTPLLSVVVTVIVVKDTLGVGDVVLDEVEVALI
jgi:hypothetical protein